MVNALDVTEKIGSFIEKYTGSAYNYTDPTAPNDKDYTQIGEVFGFPIWIDNNDRYENEFLEFPSLSDILQTLVPSISFDIKFGDCMVCLVISYNLPLIQYPPITICLAKPECGKEDEEKAEGCIPIDDLPDIPDQGAQWDDIEEKIPFPPPCRPDEATDPDNFEPIGEEGKNYFLEVWEISESLSYGMIQSKSMYISEGITESYREHIPKRRRLKGSSIVSGPIQIIQRYQQTIDSRCNNGGAGAIQGHSQTIGYGGQGTFPWTAIYGGDAFLSSSCYLDRWDSRGFRRWDAGWNYVYSEVIVKEYPSGIPVKRKEKEKPPSIPSPEVLMDCCDDTKKLLARLEKKVDSLVKVIKPEDFTKNKITIPANWIYPTTSDNPVVLEDIPDYLGAIARLFDRRTGAFPQVVKIKDTKPEEEGDQGDSIVVNSAADLQRATLEYLIASQASVGANQIMTLATLQESALTHYIAASMERKVQAIVEYLDFELDEKSEILKMACNPTAEPEEGEELSSYLPKLVKPYEQPIETINWKGGESLKDMLMDMRSKLIYAASAVTETRDPDKVVEQYLQLQRLLRLLNVREIDERLGVKDLKNFFDESEKGFPTSGLPKQFKDKPYGFGLTETPKFARLTSKSKKTKYKKPKAGDNPNV